MRRDAGRSWAAVWLIALALCVLAPAVARAEAQPTEANQARAGVHIGAEDAEATEPAPTLDLRKLGLQIFNFAVLATLLGWFGGKAVNKALFERHQQLKADLVAASEARAVAELRVAEQEKRLTSLEDEIDAIRAGIKVEAEAEKQRLIAAAEERAKRIAVETTFLLDQQVKEAEATLKREVAEAAVKIAEQLVTRAFDGRDQQRLLDTFVSDVSGVSGVAGGRSA